MARKRIGIIGSRRRNTPSDYMQVLNAFLRVYEPGDEIVSGGCPKGGDAFAEEIARVMDVPIRIHRPDWKKFGRWAGFERNRYIASDAEVLIACVAQDRKGGTEDTIKKYRKLGKRELILV